MTKRRKLIWVISLAAACVCCGLALTFARANAPVTYAEEQCLHDYSVFVRTVAPTCTEDGYDIMRCSLCGETTNYYHTEDGDYADYEPLGHNWDEKANTIVVEPTCTESGITCHYCTRCGATYTEKPTNATGHDFDDTTFDPDCETGGYTEHYCRKCGYSYTDEETDPLGHTYIRTITPATCTAGGRTYFWCSVCHYSYTGDYTDALGHDYVDDVVEPGCEAYGYTLHTCSRCEDSYYDSVTAPYGHLFDGISQVVATDTSYGYVKLSCSVCGYVYITNIVSPGETDEEHDFYLTKVSADCYGGGYWLYECADCGACVTCNETDPLEHDWALEYVAPTCTEDGGWFWVCAVCKERYLEMGEASLGHDLYVTAFAETTCTEDGYAVYDCGNCAYSYMVVTPATGHIYEVGNVTVSTGGTLSLTYTCRGCSSSAISRLYVVFSGADGDSYTYLFASDGTLNFSSLPEGYYTATVYDAVLGEAVFAFLTGEDASSSDGGTSKEDPEGSGGEEHTHSYVPTVALNASAKTVTVSYKCVCGDDLTEGLTVTFTGDDEATVSYAVDASGTVSFADLPAGNYEGYVYCGDEKVALFSLTIEGASAGDTDADDDESASGGTDIGDSGDTGTSADEGTSHGTDEGDNTSRGTETGDTENADASADEGALSGTDTETEASDAEAGNTGETPTATDSEEKKSNNTTIIVLFVVFVVFVAAIIAVWVVFKKRSKKKAAEEENSDSRAEGSDTPFDDEDDDE